MCNTGSLASYLITLSFLIIGSVRAENSDIFTEIPNFNIQDRAIVMPFMKGVNYLPTAWIDSFLKIKIMLYGESIFLYPKQNYKDLVGKKYGTAYLSCHYGDNWAWAVDDFDSYAHVYGKWGKFHDSPDEFVFAITTNNNDLSKMHRDCRRSLEADGVKIANTQQISFGANYSYVWGTRLTQYSLVFYSEPNKHGVSHLIINN